MTKKASLWGLIFLVAASLVWLMPAPSTAGAPSPKTSAVLKAGGGAVGGIGYMVMTGMSNTVRKAYPRIDVTVVPGGWVGNLYRVNSGELDIGSTTVAMCSLASQKVAPFEKPMPQVRSMYGTQDRLYYFAIVRKDAPVNSLAELFAKKVPLKLCTIQKGTTTELMWRNVFNSQGVTWEDLEQWGGKMNFVAWGDAVNLVKDNHADGILAVGVRKMGWVMDLTNSREMKILKWDDNLFKILNKKFGFDTDAIPGGTYPGIKDAVECPTDSGEVIVNANIPDDVVTAILTALADNAAAHSKYHKALANFTAAGMAKNIKLPLHPAAKKFYQERGIQLPK